MANKMVWYRKSKPSGLLPRERGTAQFSLKNDPQKGPDGTCKDILNSICVIGVMEAAMKYSICV